MCDTRHARQTVFQVVGVVAFPVRLAGIPAAKHFRELTRQVELVRGGKFRQKLEGHAKVDGRVEQIAHRRAALHHVVTHDLGVAPGGGKFAEPFVFEAGQLLLMVRAKRRR